MAISLVPLPPPPSERRMTIRKRNPRPVALRVGLVLALAQTGHGQTPMVDYDSNDNLLIEIRLPRPAQRHPLGRERRRRRGGRRPDQLSQRVPEPRRRHGLPFHLRRLRAHGRPRLRYRRRRRHLDGRRHLHGRQRRRLLQRRQRLGAHRPGFDAKRLDALQRHLRRQRPCDREPAGEPRQRQLRRAVLGAARWRGSARGGTAERPRARHMAGRRASRLRCRGRPWRRRGQPARWRAGRRSAA